MPAHSKSNLLMYKRFIVSHIFIIQWIKQFNQVLLLRALIELCLCAGVLVHTPTTTTPRTPVIGVFRLQQLSEWLIKMLLHFAQNNTTDKTAQLELIYRALLLMSYF